MEPLPNDGDAIDKARLSIESSFGEIHYHQSTWSFVHHNSVALIFVMKSVDDANRVLLMRRNVYEVPPEPLRDWDGNVRDAVGSDVEHIVQMYDSEANRIDNEYNERKLEENEKETAKKLEELSMKNSNPQFVAPETFQRLETEQHAAANMCHPQWINTEPNVMLQMQMHMFASEMMMCNIHWWNTLSFHQQQEEFYAHSERERVREFHENEKRRKERIRRDEVAREIQHALQNPKVGPPPPPPPTKHDIGEGIDPKVLYEGVFESDMNTDQKST
jgi:hypothetical protein